jgi:hypothetical protein
MRSAVLAMNMEPMTVHTSSACCWNSIGPGREAVDHQRAEQDAQRRGGGDAEGQGAE